MLVGYARVSTADQSLDLQMDALQAAGCEKIYTDIISGSRRDRPGMTQLLEYVRDGDTIVVWKLDRWGRSISHLIESIRILGERGVEFRSLQDAIDTSTSGGRLVFHMMSALAEFERDLVRERTTAGLAAARARGHLPGRPHTDADKVAAAQAMRESGQPVSTICKTLQISRSTYYRITSA